MLKNDTWSQVGLEEGKRLEAEAKSDGEERNVKRNFRAKI